MFVKISYLLSINLTQSKHHINIKYKSINTKRHHKETEKTYSIAEDILNT